MQYYKKVEASQFLLTDEEKDAFKKGKHLEFEGGQVRTAGGNQFQVTMQKGENIVRIHETQWLVRHPDGLWQIYWPDEFNKQFLNDLELLEWLLKANVITKVEVDENMKPVVVDLGGFAMTIAEDSSKLSSPKYTIGHDTYKQTNSDFNAKAEVIPKSSI